MSLFNPRLAALATEFAEIRLMIPPRSTPTCQDAAEACNCSLEQIIKTVILCGKNKKGTTKEFVAVILRGCDKIDQAVMKRMINCQKLSFATAEETLAECGYPPGGVPPVGLNEGLRVFMEVNVLNYDKVIGGGGDHEKLMEIPPHLILNLNNIQEAQAFAEK